MLIRDIPLCEKPRERLLSVGASNLSNEELISIILGTGTKNKSVKELSYDILKSIKTLSDLKEYSINKLTKIKGIGKTKAISLVAAIELGRRVYSTNTEKHKVKMTTSKDVYMYFKEKLENKKQEYFYVLYLDTKKNLIEKKMIFKGTVNTTITHPREIFKEAFNLSSSAIICVHNHPTGDSFPSNKDIVFTNRLKKTSSILGIEFLDHIIIGKNEYYSFFKERKI